MKALHKITIALCLLFSLTMLTSHAQGIFDGPEPEPRNDSSAKFKMHGKPIILIFTNFHAGFGDQKDKIGFDLDRSYLGYRLDFTKDLYATLIFDIGLPGKGLEIERIAYIKNAMITWKPGKFMLKAGLISLEQFTMQMDYWKYSYMYRSFQDIKDFGKMADMGVLVKYQFTNWFEADAFFINGEGYRKLQMDNKFRYGIGITFKPIEGLAIRFYGDRNDVSNKDSLGKAQENLGVFIGYQNHLFSVGAEFNNLFNSHFLADYHQHGFSAYLSFVLPKNFEIFSRWDYLFSNRKEDINTGHTAILGFQYSPIKYVQIAPNYRMFVDQNGKINHFAYLNLQVQF